MKKSDIFDSFVKIAQEKGLISNDSSEAKKKLEQTGRADSLDISAIEALYGVKPDAPKGNDYKKNIMEAAHPNSVVVCPSYDKLNGLVENNIERQNILLHIVNKTPNGHLTNQKYAQQDLVLSLVRLGNDLDNQNQDKLRALADFCLLQAGNKQMKKEAWVLPVVLAVVAVLGAVWANGHLPNFSRELEQDYERLEAALNKFLTSNTNWGVGHVYDEELKTDVKGFISRLDKFMAEYRSLSDVARSLEKPQDAKDVIETSKDPKSKMSIQAHNQLKNLVDNMATYIDQMEQNFSSSMYKARHTKETGGISSLLEVTHMVGGKTALTADDFEEVLNAISPFKDSVNGLLKFFKETKPAYEAKASQDLSSSLQAAKPQPSRSVQDIDEEVSKMDSDMQGLGN